MRLHEDHCLLKNCQEIKTFSIIDYALFDTKYEYNNTIK